MEPEKHPGPSLSNGLADINDDGELEIRHVGAGDDSDSDSDSESGGDGDDEELVGLDWDPKASAFEKVTPVLEYRSRSSAGSPCGADNAWSSRRRLLTHIVPMGATTIVFLDFSPNWAGPTAYDGFASGTYGVAMLLSFAVGRPCFSSAATTSSPSGTRSL